MAKSLKDQAEVGILLQVPRGNKEPVVLTKVLHSPLFLKSAAAENIHIDIPEETNNVDEGDSSGDSDVEEKLKGVAKVAKATKKDDDDDDEDDNDEQVGGKKKSVEMKDAHKESAGGVVVEAETVDHGKDAEKRMRPTKSIPRSRLAKGSTSSVPDTLDPQSTLRVNSSGVTDTVLRESEQEQERPKKRARVQKDMGSTRKKGGPTARPVFAQQKAESKKRKRSD